VEQLGFIKYITGWNYTAGAIFLLAFLVSRQKCIVRLCSL